MEGGLRSTGDHDEIDCSKENLSIPTELLEILTTPAATIATTGPDGEPHAAAVYFASDDQVNLYFFSSSVSQHIIDVLKDNRAAITIHPECSGWQDIRGLQMRGRVHHVNHGPEWERAWEIYTTKFPFAAALKSIVARNELYLFLPVWVRLVDNRQGFGHKQEWLIEGGIPIETTGVTRLRGSEKRGKTRG
jgi:uncharacterized protein YhbP (UPF0306 family)